jgi:transcriptional regulator with XRE-family HTH domain
MNRSLTATAPARNVRADAFVAQMQSTDRAAFARAIERQDMAELERAAIASRIKEARKEAGLSQPEMAAALDVIPRTYQNYESVSNPRTPWGLLNQIATVTGKTTEWLIHGERQSAPRLVDTLNGNSRSQLDRLEKKVDAILDHFGVRPRGADPAETLAQAATRASQLAREGRDRRSGDGRRKDDRAAEG